MTRALAVRALVRIDDGAYANVVLPALLRESGFDVRDRAQVTEWVYGTVRRRRPLDVLLAPCLSRPIERLDPPVRAALRLGAYQLVTGTAAHAAVGETVAAVGRVAPRAKGFVNAVLRALAATAPVWPDPAGDDIASIGLRTSMPDWIVELLVAELGLADARSTLAVMNEAPAVTLRVNPTRATVEHVASELTAAGLVVGRGALLSDSLVVSRTGDLGRLSAIRDGRATPQDQASQSVARFVDPAPGDRILEIGAAPGGKVTAIAEQMGDDGVVVAVDANPARTRMVAAASRRLRLRAVRAVVADGRRLPVPAAAFDRVLLDAPCSGLGVLRRRPEARWSLRPEQISELASLQRELLAAAALAVRPGGRLVYSVCTLSAAETTEVDAWARDALPRFTAVDAPGPPWTPIGRGARLLPAAAETDGMYALILEAPG